MFYKLIRRWMPLPEKEDGLEREFEESLQHMEAEVEKSVEILETTGSPLLREKARTLRQPPLKIVENR